MPKFEVESASNVVLLPEGSYLVSVKFMGWDDPVPFCASEHDTEEHGRMIFEKCQSGEYGPITMAEDTVEWQLSDKQRQLQEHLTAIERQPVEVDEGVAVVVASSDVTNLRTAVMVEEECVVQGVTLTFEQAKTALKAVTRRTNEIQLIRAKYAEFLTQEGLTAKQIADYEF